MDRRWTPIAREKKGSTTTKRHAMARRIQQGTGEKIRHKFQRSKGNIQQQKEGVGGMDERAETLGSNGMMCVYVLYIPPRRDRRLSTEQMERAAVGISCAL